MYTPRPRNSTPKYRPNRNEHTCSANDLFWDIHGTCVHKSPNSKTTQMPINRRTNTQIVVTSYHETLPSNEKEPIITCKDMDKFHKHNGEQKKPERTRWHGVRFHSYVMQRQAKFVDGRKSQDRGCSWREAGNNWRWAKRGLLSTLTLSPSGYWLCEMTNCESLSSLWCVYFFTRIWHFNDMSLKIFLSFWWFMEKISGWVWLVLILLLGWLIFC